MSATVMLEPDGARLAPALAAIRRTVHAHPESGFLVRTAERFLA